MTDTSILRLMQNARIKLPGAVDDAIKLEFYNALNDFFQGSNIWREDISVPVVAGTTDYTISSTASSNIVRLISVLDDNDLPVSATLDLISQKLSLALAPSTNATYTAQVALTIDEPMDGDGYPIFPFWVLNLYLNDLIDGVVGRMMSQAAKPYSNAALATRYMRNFTVAIGAARAEANREFTYGAQRWRFPQSFNRYKGRR